MEEARRHIGIVEEGGDNRGPAVEAFLRASEINELPKGQAAPAGSNWCSAFTCHVMRQEVPDAIECSVAAKGVMSDAIEIGAYHELGTYDPKPGDLIFFERGVTGDWKGHIGFVESVGEDGTIYTIEGNKENPEDPDGPDGVFRIAHSPDEFAQDRIMGFGNMVEIAHHSSREFILPEFDPKTILAYQGFELEVAELTPLEEVEIDTPPILDPLFPG